MVQSKGINFNGQNIYIGIDVHLKSWSVTIITESNYKKTHSQKSSAKELFEHLKKHYPGGKYKAVYESGFSGYSTYYSLKEYGIDCIIIHAADAPTTQYENVMKTDAIDSEKLAKSLKSGILKGIYIREKESLDDRNLIRLRKTLQRQLAGYKSRVKHLLYNNGVEYPACFDKPSLHWSKRFTLWLRNDVTLLSSTRYSLDLLLDQVTLFRKNLLKANRMVRELASRPKYAERYENLISIPGVGTVTAMSLLTEVDDINRFQNQREFASFLGLIPSCHSSGETICNMEKTFRGNKQLGPLIIESARVAIRYDKALAIAYSEYCRQMKGQEAIIRIARKLSNRILSVLKSGKKYQYDRCR